MKVKIICWVGLILSGICVYLSAFPLYDERYLIFALMVTLGASGFLLNMWVLSKDGSSSKSSTSNPESPTMSTSDDGTTTMD